MEPTDEISAKNRRF